MAKIYSPWRTTWGNGIAKNSLAVVVGSLVTIKSGFADLAVAGDRVRGIALADQTFAADNETVMQKLLEFKPFDDYSIIEIEVEDATIAQANVDSLYDLKANGTVNGTTAGTGTSLRLKEVKTSTVGLFQIAK